MLSPSVAFNPPAVTPAALVVVVVALIVGTCLTGRRLGDLTRRGGRGLLVLAVTSGLGCALLATTSTAADGAPDPTRPPCAAPCQDDSAR